MEAPGPIPDLPSPEDALREQVIREGAQKIRVLLLALEGGWNPQRGFLLIQNQAESTLMQLRELGNAPPPTGHGVLGGNMMTDMAEWFRQMMGLLEGMGLSSSRRDRGAETRNLLDALQVATKAGETELAASLRSKIGALLGETDDQPSVPRVVLDAVDAAVETVVAERIAVAPTIPDDFEISTGEEGDEYALPKLAPGFTWSVAHGYAELFWRGGPCSQGQADVHDQDALRRVVAAHGAFLTVTADASAGSVEVRLSPELRCLSCKEPATWVRHTQFAGDHPFCDVHARAESDFGEDDSTKDWELAKAWQLRLDALARRLSGPQRSALRVLAAHENPPWAGVHPLERGLLRAQGLIDIDSNVTPFGREVLKCAEKIPGVAP